MRKNVAESPTVKGRRIIEKCDASDSPACAPRVSFIKGGVATLRSPPRIRLAIPQGIVAVGVRIERHRARPRRTVVDGTCARENRSIRAGRARPGGWLRRLGLRRCVFLDRSTLVGISCRRCIRRPRTAGPPADVDGEYRGRRFHFEPGTTIRALGPRVGGTAGC